jgi:tetratricopeptide (TPR) repeat protein
MKTLTEVYGESEGREDALEALYQMGEINNENGLPDEAREHWEQLALKKPANSPWRLQGLVKLGEIYEADRNYPEAARIYEDISNNAASPEVAKAAAERARSLLRMTSQGKPGPAPAAGARQPAAGTQRPAAGPKRQPAPAAEESPPDGAREAPEELPPPDEPPAAKAKPAKKSAAPVNVRDLPGLQGTR